MIGGLRPKPHVRAGVQRLRQPATIATFDQDEPPLPSMATDPTGVERSVKQTADWRGRFPRNGRGPLAVAAATLPPYRRSLERAWAYVAGAYCGLRTLPLAGGINGVAAWAAMQMTAANLGGRITTDELAAVCSLGKRRVAHALHHSFHAGRRAEGSALTACAYA
jgi:hypothetical protein